LQYGLAAIRYPVSHEEDIVKHLSNWIELDSEGNRIGLQSP